MGNETLMNVKGKMRKMWIVCLVCDDDIGMSIIKNLKWNDLMCVHVCCGWGLFWSVVSWLGLLCRLWYGLVSRGSVGFGWLWERWLNVVCWVDVWNGQLVGFQGLKVGRRRMALLDNPKQRGAGMMHPYAFTDILLHGIMVIES